MNIKDIRWPVFAIGSDTHTYTDMNVTYIEHSGITSILDNKNIEGDTLGKRRMRIQGEQLYIFRKTLFMISELVEYTRPKKIIDRKFMDSAGVLFTYNKTKIHKLIWRKVTNVEKLSSTSIITVAELQEKFEIPNNYWNKYKDEEYVWLGLLAFDRYHSIYDVSTSYRKDTWRKV